MCGITGIYSFNQAGKLHLINLSRATDSLGHRGPDSRGVFHDDHVGLGHRRLSILDLSPLGNQPMGDESGRYHIVYNGEIFNFQELKQELQKEGVSFNNKTDTEVILKLYIHKGTSFINKLNGFFAFAIYDQKLQSLFIARDRYGIKPLYYLIDEDKFLFSSEVQGICKYGVDKSLDIPSLLTYLQLNYIPSPYSIFKNIRSLPAGHFGVIKDKKFFLEKYYQINNLDKNGPNGFDYEEQLHVLRELVHSSVSSRLVSDVPLGCFLSGGVDSTIIAGVAAQYKPNLHTFSIGYENEPYFDETDYANLAAEKFGTKHQVFKVTNLDLENVLHNVLGSFDQPFADSSALPVYLLSQLTRKEVTVALSGDGADELFSGYNKHAAFYKMDNSVGFNSVVSMLSPLWAIAPKSRNNPLANKFRQIYRYSEGLKASPSERYWMWASLANLAQATSLLHDNIKSELDLEEFAGRKKLLLSSINGSSDINQVLLTDMNMVLEGDMLKKVDLMSMANGLEVRVPFLDYRIVDYVFTLPVGFKINGKMRKRILQDSFKDLLPPRIYQRPKHGFEVPLLRWFKGSMSRWIFDDILHPDKIESQGIFNPGAIYALRKKLGSSGPGDSHATLWALIVFQSWYRRFFPH